MPQTLQEFVEEQNQREPWSPAHIIDVQSREELKRHLHYYGIPVFRFDEPGGRRYFMEYIRPALRYFCMKLDVEMPDWLEAEDHYGHGDGEKEQMMELFGVPKLEPATWDQWMFEEVESMREEEEDEPGAPTDVRIDD